jgi:hypothetical protein
MSEYPKQTGPNSWIVEVKENGKTKELYLEFPPGSLDQVGWHVGDNLEWIEDINNSWTLKKVDK